MEKKFHPLIFVYCCLLLLFVVVYADTVDSGYNGAQITVGDGELMAWLEEIQLDQPSIQRVRQPAWPALILVDQFPDGLAQF